MVTHRGSVLALVAGLFAAAVAPSGRAETDRAACRAHGEVRPSRAVPGQQVVYVARIVRREDVQKVEWERPLSFPGFRAEWLPGRAEDTRMQYRGVAYLAREEHRALFAARPGELAIPPAILRCTVAGRGPRPARIERVEVPGVSLRVEPIPERARPEGWSGLVGPVQVVAVAEPRELSLGESVRLSVQVRGAANLWAIDPPLDPNEPSRGVLGDVEIFARRAELSLDEGERLHARRFFRYDLVPRAAGRLAIPSMRFPYFDPSTGGFGEARTQAIEVAVVERQPAAAPRSGLPTPDAASDRGSGESAASDAGSAIAWVGGLLVAAALAVVAWRWRRSDVDRWRAVDRALAAAERQAREGDPLAEARELARALRAALAAISSGEDWSQRDPAALRRASEGVEAPASPELLRELADQLDALDWVRFSDELGHPDREGARRLVRTLRESA